MGKNKFGGQWTIDKVDIFTDYLKAYLHIMNQYPFKLIYFDGFAGCGTVDLQKEANALFGEAPSLLESVAIKTLSLDHSKKFDIYYLVELDRQKALDLESLIKSLFPTQTGVFVVQEDCNKKLESLAEFLAKNKNHRALAFIDPFGMCVNWSTLEKCKDLGIDMWILIPTGVGANRLLTKDGKIEDAWLSKLENFLGIPRAEIRHKFYRTSQKLTLFDGEISEEVKVSDATLKIAALYKERLSTIWKLVSSPFPMKNSRGCVMYHFLLATNNSAGLKIANDIIKNKTGKV